MRHGILENQLRKYRNEFGGRTVPLILGLLTILWGVIGAIWGCTLVTERTYDQEQTAWALALVGGLYMLLTGLWFASRPALTARRFIGFSIMVFGVQWGAWMGILILADNKDGHFGPAQTVFFSGLLIHIAGVIYVWKE